MYDFYEIRKKHGNVFTTSIDNLTIPWKPLLLSEYIQYTIDTRRGLIPIQQLEDEIFCKCVLDKTIVRQINTLKAGIIATVVQNIWEYSGPTGIDAFNRDLDQARGLLNADGVKGIHSCVQLITTAFPYKPEEVYSMDYETLLIRLAQAEKKLIEVGMLTEPIALKTPSQTQHKPPRRGPQPSDPNQSFNQKIDAKALWDAQEERKRQPAKPPSNQKFKVGQDMSDTPRDKWWNKSPILETEEKHNIDLAIQGKEVDKQFLDNHERTESKEMQEHILKEKNKEGRAKMIEDAKWIYKDVLEELEKKKNS